MEMVGNVITKYGKKRLKITPVVKKYGKTKTLWFHENMRSKTGVEEEGIKF